MSSSLTPDFGLLTPENEQFVRHQLESGAYTRPAEVINAGLDVLRQRQGLRDRLARSARQLETSQCAEFDQAGLRKWFDELEHGVQRQIAAKRAKQARRDPAA